MEYQSLYGMTVADLRKLAKLRMVKVPAGTKKAMLVELLLESQQRDTEEKTECDACAALAREDKAAEATESVGNSAEAKMTLSQPEASEVSAAEAESIGALPENADVKGISARREPSAMKDSPAFREGAALQHGMPGRGFRVQRGFQPRERFARGGEVRQMQSELSSAQRSHDEKRKPYAQDGTSRPAERSMGDSARRYCDETRVLRDAAEIGGECTPAGDFADGAGVLEILSDGYGVLRAENYLPGSRDVYISMAQIRRFNLRNGDHVEGKIRPQREGDRYSALMYIVKINGEPPERAARRRPFESLVPVYPDQRLRLESGKNADLSLRLIDMLAPIGKGQRGMIVAQPKAGKTTLLKKIANAISENNPEVELIVLLIDERPEEVTDMRRSIRGEVVYSTFDEAPENHTRVSELVLEHAQRMVEMGRDVVILMDSITRLARAYNLVIPPTGRSLSGGLDPGALHKPKRFFGAARNIEGGGSLTIIATALVDTGSRMDDIIFEEFKGTGNMELHLDRRLSERRIFPAIDLFRSGTRREELLLSPKELEGAVSARRLLSNGGAQQSAELLIGLVEKTESNEEAFERIKGWQKAYVKDGFSMNGGK